MNCRSALILALPLTLALAACGSSQSADTPAEADTVEIPANEALQNVPEQPVADPSANATEAAAQASAAAEAEQQKIQDAGDNAADTAAAAMDAMGTQNTEQDAQQ